MIIVTQDYSSKHSQDIVTNTHDEKQALLVVNAYMDSWNARDVSGTDDTLHFPHIRMASGKVTLMEKGAIEANFFENFSKRTGWEYSLWDYRRAIQSCPDKVHFAVQFTRYLKDGVADGVFPSMWIVTKVDGKWGIQARSSFAP
ncbi:MAG: hypothetical protein ACI9FB_003187 [Candidatus Azotimanducaceae bacterium]|jgi:hypothetical protein